MQRATRILLRYLLMLSIIWSILSQFVWSEFGIELPDIWVVASTGQSGVVLTVFTPLRPGGMGFFAEIGEYKLPNDHSPGFGLHHFANNVQYHTRLIVPGFTIWRSADVRSGGTITALFMGHLWIIAMLICMNLLFRTCIRSRTMSTADTVN